MLKRLLLTLLLASCCTVAAQAGEPREDSTNINVRVSVLESRLKRIEQQLANLETVPSQLARISADVNYLSTQSRRQRDDFTTLFVAPVITGVIALSLGLLLGQRNGRNGRHDNGSQGSQRKTP